MTSIGNQICINAADIEIFSSYLDKKVKPAHSDGFIDKVATFGALKPIGVVHQVWKIELRGKGLSCDMTRLNFCTELKFMRNELTSLHI